MIDGSVAFRNGEPLDPHTDLAGYSDQGMDWGCNRPPSHQLAFALLMDHIGDAAQARRLVPAFTERVVARLDNEWELDSDYIAKAVSIIEYDSTVSSHGPERFG